MATKRPSRKVIKNNPEPQETVVVQEEVVMSVERPRRKWLIPAVLLLGLLFLYWYRTNTWPVSAIVNGQPITRFELNQQLYKQGGQEVLDGLITERLIKSELSKQKVEVSGDEVNSRLDEIKNNLGENYQLALSAQGLTEEQLREQISTQIQVEKLLSDQASVSAEEVDAILKDFPNRAEAEKFAKQQKVQGLVSEWVSGLRDKAKIYIVGEQAKATE